MMELISAFASCLDTAYTFPCQGIENRANQHRPCAIDKHRDEGFVTHHRGGVERLHEKAQPLREDAGADTSEKIENRQGGCRAICRSEPLQAGVTKRVIFLPSILHSACYVIFISKRFQEVSNGIDH